MVSTHSLVVCICDRAGTLLVSNDDQVSEAFSRFSALATTASADDTYIIEVTAFNDTSGGAYVLNTFISQ